MKQDHFFESCKKGYLNKAKRCLTRGFLAKLFSSPTVDVNTTDEKKKTALMWAAENGHLDIAKLLINHEININEKDINGCTALMFATNNGHIDITALLIDNGADINACDNCGSTALILSVYEYQNDITKLYIEKGADIDASENDGSTALTWAVRHDEIEVVQLLLEKGVNINAFTDDGWTPLIYVISNNHTRLTKLLLENGADVNAQAKDGNTALLMAIDPDKLYVQNEQDQLETVKLLLKNGAVINITDDKTMEILAKAIQHGNTELVSCLKKNNADIELIVTHKKETFSSSVKIGEKEYSTVRIGNQLWMKENLDEPTTRSSEHEKHEDGGLLYTHQDAVEICPKGWRLPSEQDFRELTQCIDSCDDLLPNGKSNFNAKPLGFRNAANSYCNYPRPRFWTSTQAHWADYPGQYALFELWQENGKWEVFITGSMPSLKYPVRYISDN